MNVSVTPPGELTEALRTFAARGSIVIATDFDGVLAPIVWDPMSARPQPGTIDALRSIASVSGATVSVVSGRDLATLRLLTGVTDEDNIVLIGSHGAEGSRDIAPDLAHATPRMGPREEQALESAHEALRRVVEQIPQARIEQKPAGVVLHTRGLDDALADEATSLAMTSAETIPGVHAMRGKSVVELTVLEVSKGAALEALVTDVGAHAIAYFGDDVTDETVFSAFSRGDGHVTVKVGDGPTSAAFRISDCTDIPELFATLENALTS